MQSLVTTEKLIKGKCHVREFAALVFLCVSGSIYS